jgi:uncharacterized repeat protein (TIGR01451 family)
LNRSINATYDPMKNLLPPIIRLELISHKIFTMLTVVLSLFWVLPSHAALSSTPMPPPGDCGAPVSVFLFNITSQGADLNFVASDPLVYVSYDYEIQPLDSAQGSASLILSGNTGDNDSIFNITGLNPATFYSVYVRAICDSNIASEWMAPLDLYTSPVCGSTWYDNGGPEDYYSSSSETTTICPDVPGQVLSVVFTSFNVEDGWDALYIHDGPNSAFPTLFGSDYILNSGFPAGGITGSVLPNNGCAIYSTHVSGCLTFDFYSDTAVNTSGWSAQMSCQNAPACGIIYNPVLNSVTANGASISAAASIYGDIENIHWEAQPQGLAQGTPGGITGVSNSVPIILDGLTGSTNYTAYFQVDCTNNESSIWTCGFDFLTAPDCQTGEELVLGQEYTATFSGPGVWNLGPSGTGAGPHDTNGAEVIFKLNAPATGVYTFTRFDGDGWVDYFIKPVVFGCSEQNWVYQDDNFGVESFAVTLNAGDYYVLMDAESGAEVTASSFAVYGPVGLFDQGASCNNPVVIECGQPQASHSIGPILSVGSGGWANIFDCETAHNAGSFWFEYTASSNETITLGTLNSQTNFDSRVSVYSGECGSLSCMATSDGSSLGDYNAFATFTAQSGQTYYIGVGGHAVGTGDQHFQLGLETTCGCTDPAACNFDPDALVDNGSCLYGTDCEDCLDLLADNYNPYATIDNGSCIYSGKIKVYYDDNGNGSFNNGEAGMANFGVHFDQANVTIFTNPEGEIQFVLEPGTYSIHLLLDAGYINSSALSATLIVPSGEITYFGVALEENADYNLTVTQNVQSGILHCTNGYFAGANINYFSTFSASGQLTMTCDPMFTPEANWQGTPPNIVMPGFAQWDIASLNYGVSQPQFRVDGPGVEFLGQQFDFNFQLILNNELNNEIYNHEWTNSKMVQCAYDPNDIAVTPVGYAAPHFVSKGEELVYKIQFQNTGNYPAEDIIVVDVLDPTVFDLSTFVPIIASDYMTTCLHDDGTLDFIFNDIYLADSVNNEPESHGWLLYRVSLWEDIDGNTIANNFADIYFEQNPPVTTNTVFNTVFDCESFSGIFGESEYCNGETVSLTGEQMYVDDYSWTINSEALYNTPDVEMSGLVEGDYAVGLTVANPICEMTYTSGFVIHPLPTIDAGDDVTMCEGESFILQATSDGSITWGAGQNNGEIYYPMNSEVLQANSTSIFGCTSADEINIILAELPGNVLSENGATLSAPAGTSWQWYFNNELIAGATTQTIVVTQSGNYNVVTANENNCTSISESIFVTIGLSENNQNDVHIYPNPIQETAFVQLPAGVYSVRLLDATGKLAMDLGNHQNSFVVQRNGLACGKYQLELTHSNKRTYVTLIFE